MKIHVFDADKLSRRVLDRTWPNLRAKKAEDDPKLTPQNDPKCIKNRCRKLIEILIDFGIDFCAIFWKRDGGPAAEAWALPVINDRS